MPEKFLSIDEILDFAIKNEENAADMYEALAAKASDPVVKKNLQEFANEEREHKKTLERVKKGKKLLSPTAPVADLKIADHLEAAPAHPDMSYQELLIFAMKQEKAAFRLYSFLAETTDDRKLRDTLLSLANEEAKHKLNFEIQYDDEIMKEN